MDNFIVSARKYRPATFETVVGQQHITHTLKNAIRNNQLAQAFLFCGPRGVGKTTCARILAKTINCENLTPENEACGECASCKAFQNGNSFNVHELDAASNNSVEDIRSLIEQVRIPPQSGKFKIYIIDEVHMLSQAAFNAFLKTLEEPPSYAIFILATTEKHKILPTILSRCQIFDFNRIRVEDIAQHLAAIATKESIAFENDGLHIIAQKADGGLRDALSMFDQIVSFSGGSITYKSVIDNLNILDYDYFFRITDYLLAENTAEALLLFDEILANGFDGSHFIGGLSSHFRNILVGKDNATLKLLEVSEGIRRKYLEQAEATSVSFLLSALNIANQCDLNYKLSKNQRLQVELALLKMCHLPAAFNLATASITEGVKKKPESVGLNTEVKQPVETLSATKPKQQAVERSAEVAPVKFSAPVSSPVNKEEKAVKSLYVAPRATASVKIPSLNELGKAAVQVEEPDDPYLKGVDREDFHYDAFLALWNEYTARIKSENKMSLLTIFTSMAPVMLEPYKFEIIVGNKMQEGEFRDEKPNLMNFLRTKLRNFDIDIQTRIDEIVHTKKPYTVVEKYHYMAQKNPFLAELRNRFNLDIDA